MDSVMNETQLAEKRYRDKLIKIIWNYYSNTLKTNKESRKNLKKNTKTVTINYKKQKRQQNCKKAIWNK